METLGVCVYSVNLQNHDSFVLYTSGVFSVPSLDFGNLFYQEMVFDAVIVKEPLCLGVI